MALLNFFIVATPSGWIYPTLNVSFTVCDCHFFPLALRGIHDLCCRGYGCADHFFENDTELHSWEVLAKLLDDPTTFVSDDFKFFAGIGRAVHETINYRSMFLRHSISGYNL